MQNVFIAAIFCLSNLVLCPSCSSRKKRIDINEDGSKIEYELNKENRIEGIVRHYYPNGNLKNERIILNDKKDGIEKDYYDNGLLAKKQSWINGHLIGDVFEYNENGKIHNHMFYTLGDANGLIFFRQYDSLGNVEKEEGSFPIWIALNQRSLKVNDTIEILIFTSASNDFKFRYSVQECLYNNQCTSLVSEKVVEEMGTQILAKKSVLKHVVKTNDPFYWIVSIEMEDQQNKNLRIDIDTLYFNRK